MSLPWQKRKNRLSYLLNSPEDEDAEGLALDRILHGQSVIGKTGQFHIIYRSKSAFYVLYAARTSEIDTLRFTNKDLKVLGTLEYGQFGVVRASPDALSLPQRHIRDFIDTCGQLSSQWTRVRQEVY